VLQKLQKACMSISLFLSDSWVSCPMILAPRYLWRQSLASCSQFVWSGDCDQVPRCVTAKIRRPYRRVPTVT